MSAPLLDNGKTCATCKHRSDDFAEAHKYDPDTLDDVPVTYYECKRISHGNKSNDTSYRTGEHALVVDGSGYHAKFVVENDFGCNLWESK